MFSVADKRRLGIDRCRLSRSPTRTDIPYGWTAWPTVAPDFDAMPLITTRSPGSRAPKGLRNCGDDDHDGRW